MSNQQEKKGFHWGHGIIVTFVLFGAFMAYFYIHMSHEKIELVGENYYADGQAYQDKINLQNQSIPLGQQIHIKSIAKDQYILIQLPEASMDKTLIWDKKTSLNWTSSTNFLVDGPWKRTITWSVLGKNYIQEDRIIISNN
jgi:hypothetical protein